MEEPLFKATVFLTVAPCSKLVLVLLFCLKEKYFNNIYSFTGSYLIYLFWKTSRTMTGHTETELSSFFVLYSFFSTSFQL